MAIFNSLKLKKSKKKWSILIFANGNNELAPEVYSTFEEMKREFINDDINVIIQIAKAPIELVKRLRIKVNLNNLEQWNGVRRYLLNSKGITKVQDIGNVNMADSSTLYDFINWSITNYPSQHIMLILSGHGAGFVGAMTDFTHDHPYLMSFQGIMNAIYKSTQSTRKNIDCLVLDICYMNLIELWYEFAVIPSNPIKKLLVSMDNVVLKGLPYNLIIRYLQRNINNEIKTSNILTNIVKEFNNNAIFNKLLLINLSKKNFTQLKNLIDTLSLLIINNSINLSKELDKWWYFKPTHPFISIIDLSDMLSENFSKTYNSAKYMENILQKIIIYPSISIIPKRLNKGPSLYMPRNLNQYLEFKDSYNNLLFLYKNRWTNVIQCSNITTIFNTHKRKKSYDILVPPIVLKLKYIASSILEQNPNLTIKNVAQILKKLGWY